MFTDHYRLPRVQITDASSARIPSLRRQFEWGGTCRICGFSYCPDLPDNRRQHCRFHAEFIRPRVPRPDLRLTDAGDIRVDAQSPVWLHKLIYERARALRHDEGYDFAQWHSIEAPTPHDNERGIHALLLVENSNIPVGVVSFSWVDWQNPGEPAPGWHMCMAWVADSWRRRGVMTHRWPNWRETYGDFTLERPLSTAMRALIIKVGHPDGPLRQSGTLAPPPVSA